ncbi:hypothetical protein JCM14076_06240 [Methylosoma difficile]
MRIKCPACGSTSSLDALVANQSATDALMQVAKMSPIGPLVIRYLGLFRPKKSQLSWARVTTLLAELTPMIEAQRIERDGVVCDAPPHIWEVALQKIITLRDAGKIDTPLGGHGYLLDIIKTEVSRPQPDNLPVVINGKSPVAASLSATANAVNALQSMKGGSDVVAR